MFGIFPLQHVLIDVTAALLIWLGLSALKLGNTWMNEFCQAAKVELQSSAFPNNIPGDDLWKYFK